jgi:hypothetical protein
MENPIVLWFFIGFLLGTMLGTYMGNKKFRIMINKMIRGKEKPENDDEDSGDEDDYNNKNRQYRDGPHRNDRMR